ncbi:XisI protein [Aerosakkonema sp. BLCC-F183]|uniref:XisI protein n=1 Tax=Aerosakkonema sp. BLCC-F183 TaxID=3342834 RepID=UPI0035BA10A3
MAALENYRQLVKQLMSEYASFSTFDSGIENETIFDLENDRYMLLSIGWSQGRRIHYCIMHIDIIDERVWIQANNTDRLIAQELIAAGVSPESIVLGLQPPELREFTAYGLPHKQQKSLKVS